MSRLIAVACLFVAACAPQAAKAEDPLAPARSGKLLCLLPVEREKLCNELMSFRFEVDGSISTHNTVLMGDQPRLVMSVDIPMTLKDGALCGSIRPQDVEVVELTIGGAAVEPERANQFRAQMKTNIEARGIGEGCIMPTPRDGGLVLVATFDGVTQPGLDSKMIWVGPDEGYSVR